MTASLSADHWIDVLKMQPHPEGGFYAECYRSEGVIPKSVLPPQFGGDRNYATHIFFLLKEGQKSDLHKIESDELWHFYGGDPMTLFQISPKGDLEEITLGKDIQAGQKLFHCVPPGYWFGGYTKQGGAYSLVGATVSPGFDFAEFKLGTRVELLEKFPAHAALVERLTPAGA